MSPHQHPDLNRNWGEKWGGGGSSPSPCSDTYRGEAAFSAPETAAVEKLLTETLPRQGYTIVGGVDIHAYGQLILRPYGWALPREAIPPNDPELKALGERMRTAILVCLLSFFPFRRILLPFFVFCCLLLFDYYLTVMNFSSCFGIMIFISSSLHFLHLLLSCFPVHHFHLRHLMLVIFSPGEQKKKSTIAQTTDQRSSAPLTFLIHLCFVIPPQNTHGSRYTSEHAAELYVAAGGADDWFYAVPSRGKLGFTLELRDTGRYGFLLPPEQIIPTGEEVWEAIKEVLRHVAP